MSDRSPGDGVNPPPCVYTRVDWDKERRILSYEYAGRIIVTIAVTGEEPINFRAGSDSTIQTAPLIQQTFVSMDSGVASALVTFHLDQTAVAMRPQRADREEAVLGTVGGRLPHGVNGIYHKASDFLMDWHGRPWRWVDEKIHVDEGGAGHASLEVELGPEAWILNLRP